MENRSYPYLGRTEDYADFQIITPGRTLTKIETWTRGMVGIVRVTTDDGQEGWGQLSPFEPEITATVLHRQMARHVLGQDPARIDALADRCIDANMKFPWSYICRALAGIDTALWDLYGKIEGKPVCALLGGKPKPFPVYGSSMRRDISPEEEAARLVRLRDSQGFTAFKVRVGQATGHDGDAALGRTERLIPTVRRAVGEEITLLADGNSVISSPTARRTVGISRSVRPSAASPSCPVACPTRTLNAVKPCESRSRTSRAASSSGEMSRRMLEPYTGNGFGFPPSSAQTGLPSILP